MRLILDAEIQPDDGRAPAALSPDLERRRRQRRRDLRPAGADRPRRRDRHRVARAVGPVAGPAAALAPAPVGRRRPSGRRPAVAQGRPGHQRPGRLRRSRSPSTSAGWSCASTSPPRLGRRPGGPPLAADDAPLDLGRPRHDRGHRRLRLDRPRGGPPAVVARDADHRRQGAPGRPPRHRLPRAGHRRPGRVDPRADRRRRGAPGGGPRGRRRGPDPAADRRHARDRSAEVIAALPPGRGSSTCPAARSSTSRRCSRRSGPAVWPARSSTSSAGATATRQPVVGHAQRHRHAACFGRSPCASSTSSSSRTCGAIWPASRCSTRSIPSADTRSLEDAIDG